MAKTISKRLVIVLAALVIACVGLVALNGTFASQVSYSGEKVELTGETFNVDLQYWDGSEYVSLFSEDAQPFPADSQWCPGRSEIVYLKLSSNESFPVDSTVSLKVNSSGFGEVISYAVISQNLLSDPAAHPTSWEDFVNKSQSGAQVLAVNSHPLFEVKAIMPGQEQYVALCMHMAENATSQYQNQQLNLQFVLRTNADYEPGAIPGN